MPDSERARPADTTPAAHDKQTTVYRRLGGVERFRIAVRLSAQTRRIAMAGIRRRHPNYTDLEVRQAYARLQLGDAVTRAVWPDRALVDP